MSSVFGAVGAGNGSGGRGPPSRGSSSRPATPLQQGKQEISNVLVNAHRIAAAPRALSKARKDELDRTHTELKNRGDVTVSEIKAINLARGQDLLLDNDEVHVLAKPGLGISCWRLHFDRAGECKLLSGSMRPFSRNLFRVYADKIPPDNSEQQHLLIGPAYRMPLQEFLDAFQELMDTAPICDETGETDTLMTRSSDDHSGTAALTSSMARISVASSTKDATTAISVPIPTSSPAALSASGAAHDLSTALDEIDISQLDLASSVLFEAMRSIVKIPDANPADKAMAVVVGSTFIGDDTIATVTEHPTFWSFTRYALSCLFALDDEQEFVRDGWIAHLDRLLELTYQCDLLNRRANMKNSLGRPAVLIYNWPLPKPPTTEQLLLTNIAFSNRLPLVQVLDVQAGSVALTVLVPDDITMADLGKPLEVDGQKLVAVGCEMSVDFTLQLEDSDQTPVLAQELLIRPEARNRQVDLCITQQDADKISASQCTFMIQRLKRQCRNRTRAVSQRCHLHRD